MYPYAGFGQSQRRSLGCEARPASKSSLPSACRPRTSRGHQSTARRWTHGSLSSDHGDAGTSCWSMKRFKSLLLAGLTSVSVGLLPPSLDFSVVEAQAAQLTASESSTIRLFQRNTSSVVYITNLAFRRDAFTMNTFEIPQGAGSGLIWDSEGTIVTNFHVVRGASDVMVTLDGGQECAAKLVGVDQDKDIAVLKLVDPVPKNLRPIKLGSSRNLLVGQQVYCIGNPFGLDHTLTTGVISGIGREIASGATGRPIEDVIQTDAAINPGNSGGPLLNSSGEMIGINTAIYSSSGMSAGVGFAIPSDVISNSVTQILQFGKVVRPIIGITFAPEPAVEQLGISGILVLSAKPGGPAEMAGIIGTQRDEYGRLVLGDIITAVNGVGTKTSSDLFRILNKCQVGDTLDLEVLRGNNKVHVQLQLESSEPKEVPMLTTNE